MGKKNEKEGKTKIKRNIVKEERKRVNKKKQKQNGTSKKKMDKKRRKNEESDNEEENEESYEDIILPGQKYSTPPAGDATRAFYESLLEERPDSVMAKKYCVEYGCLDADKANEFIKELEKKKKKK